jgi:hypothetical protein
MRMPFPASELKYLVALARVACFRQPLFLLFHFQKLILQTAANGLHSVMVLAWNRTVGNKETLWHTRLTAVFVGPGPGSLLSRL